MTSTLEADQLDADTLSKIETIVGLIYSDYFQEAILDLLELEERVPNISEHFLEFRQTKQDIQDIQLALGILDDIDSWSLVDNSNGIKTYSKGSGNEFFVRGEMTLHSPIFPLLALFSEVDLIPLWVPRISAVQELSQPSKFRRMIRYELDIPWPCSNRDMVVSALGLPLEDRNSALIVLKSVKSSYFGQPVPEVPRGMVRVDLHLGVMNIHCISLTETHFTFIIRSNPHLMLIPTWLMNFGIKHFIYYFMEHVREKTQQYEGSEYERRVNNNPEYYKVIQDRISRYSEEWFTKG